MLERVDAARWKFTCVAVPLLTLACGGTTLSNDDASPRGSDAGSTDCVLAREGDVLVRTPAELEALRDHHLVSGDLTVACPDCTTLAPLACLEEVGKLLRIVGSDQLESLQGLSALRRLGVLSQEGGLAIGPERDPLETPGNARLRTLGGLGPLELVAGRVEVRKNPELRDLSGLFGLHQIAGSIFLEDNDALGSLADLSELWSVRGTLEIADNDALVDLTGLGSFVQTTGLGIRDNDALTTLSGLGRFWGQTSDLTVDIANNPLLADVTALENVQGTVRGLTFMNNASLRAVALNSELSIVTSGLVVRNNAVLESFTAPGLTHVDSALQIDSNPLLTTLDLGAPVSVGGLFLMNNGALRDTAAFAEVRLVSNLVLIESNGVLESVRLPELQEVGGDIRIDANPALVGFDLGALRSAESIQLRYNGLLPSCQAAALLTAVPTARESRQCDNAPDECVNECPPPP
jgi:hypothetical protein